MAVEDDDFEKPLRELEKKIEELSGVPGGDDRADEIARIQRRLDTLRQEVYARLTPWQRTLVARHPRRPYTLDYVQMLFSEFREIHGDRKYSDDPAIVAGFALYKGEPVIVIGHQKGRDTREKVRRNFGMPRPEGYRKAVRVMELAEKFGRPILTFVDTPGAYPGRGAEERGQAEAIAHNLRIMARLSVPIVVTVTGEVAAAARWRSRSGRVHDARALGLLDQPRGCAAILWSDQGKAREAARDARPPVSRARSDRRHREPPGGRADPPRMATILDDTCRGAHRSVEAGARDRVRALPVPPDREVRSGEFF